MIRRAFISYAHEDRARAERLHQSISGSGVTPWIDTKNLLPGQDWKVEIRTAIEQSNLFIALMSRHSVSKKGFVQKELRIAIDILDQMPQGEIFVIPARLDDCRVTHDRLSSIQYVDMFPVWSNGLTRLLQTFDFHAVKTRQRETNHAKEIIQETLDGDLDGAVMYGDAELVSELLAKGANPDVPATYGSLIMFAISEPHTGVISTETLEIVQALLCSGATVDQGGYHGESPLYHSATMGYVDIAKLLIRHGADINSQANDNDGRTPLMGAATFFHVGMLQLLLEEGADVNRNDHKGNTAMHYCVDDPCIGMSEPELEEEILQVTTLLAAYGANVQAQNKEGVTPIELAEILGLPKVLDFFQSRTKLLGSKLSTRVEEKAQGREVDAGQQANAGDADAV